ncbi:MAG: c-type cytochrome domain-containing protein [Sulfuricaulis sp.]|uniref:c-type cytochrome domain-containing protein n=1 Tax=Sulfuricaulis sp. TaxID=2003553 RepID=UPI0034A46A8C
MDTRISFIVVAGILAVSATGCTRDVSFKADVYPVLSRNCLACHKPGGEGYAASGLSMENHEMLMKGTKFGPVIVPGSSLNSSLVLLIEHKADPSISMPKPRKDLTGKSRAHLLAWSSEQLSTDEIGLIKKWIDQGAKNN